MKNLVLGAAAAIALAYATPAQAFAQADKNVLFILDSSGSMAQDLGGETKMAAAKRVFGEMLDQLPPETNVGLAVYGHHGDRDCSVIEVMTPVQPLDAKAIQAKVEPLNPVKGATPIAASLDVAAEALKGIEGPRAIVVISDGEETCNGDPVAKAAQLREKFGIDVSIHVVGLSVNEKQTAQLAAIAEKGGGSYYAANDADQLSESLAEIKTRVIQQTAEAKTPSVFFEDEFEGAGLSEAWQVQNQDPNSMIVDGGKLFLVSTPGHPSNGNSTNLVQYAGELPGSYEAYVKLTTPVVDYPGSSNDTTQVNLSMIADTDNMLQLTIRGQCCSDRRQIQFWKLQNGEWAPAHGISLDRTDDPVGYELKIAKNAFRYTAFYKNDNGEWQEIGTHAFLGKSLRPALDVVRLNDGRETITEIDVFRILTAE
ncbi:MAG: VWA domain-containing protein [Rhodovibrionaceae bacterium]|nr:VWA domain-containing protein [Rhodovibrionaceae bacterium]